MHNTSTRFQCTSKCVHHLKMGFTSLKCLLNAENVTLFSNCTPFKDHGPRERFGPKCEANKLQTNFSLIESISITEFERLVLFFFTRLIVCEKKKRTKIKCMIFENKKKKRPSILKSIDVKEKIT